MEWSRVVERRGVVHSGEPPWVETQAMQLELTDAERQILAEILDNALSNLKEEIYHTETYDYKEQLKLRESTLIGLLGKVQP